MFKRFISVFLVLVMMLSVFAVVPASAYESDDYAETSADNNWYTLYDDFIYKALYYNYAKYYNDIPIKFMLHDMDFDGNPELVTTNGTFVMAGGGNHVFTIKNGSVVFAGTVGFRSAYMYYHMNSSYRGLYCQDGNMGGYTCVYYDMKNYKIRNTTVFTSAVEVQGYPDISVFNSSLYKAYKNATVYDKTQYDCFGMRKFRYRLDGYTRSEIYNSLGYNNFVKKFLFLAIPKVKKFENVQGGAKITWNSIKGAEKYKVYVKSGSKWKTVGTTTDTSFIHKTAKSGTTYTYTVKCISADETRATSRYISAGFKNKFIATPQLRSIKNKSDGVRFVFYQVSGASKYRIYRKTDGTSWKKVGDVSSKKDYFLDKTAKKGVTYTYTVRCVSSDGKKHVSGYDKTGLTINRK